jgi:hypothetical protein
MSKKNSESNIKNGKIDLGRTTIKPNNSLKPKEDKPKEDKSKK